MALVIAGRIVSLDPADPDAVFKGRVFLDDQGTVDRVTSGNGGIPLGFSTAPVVDVGDGFVLPGLIDLHNHIGYNSLPLWTEPKQKTAFAHHDSWTRAATYQASISWPANALVQTEPEALEGLPPITCPSCGGVLVPGQNIGPLFKFTQYDVPRPHPVLSNPITLRGIISTITGESRTDLSIGPL
jgi:hypothetical protein